MKVVLAGAFGKLGSDILASLCKKDYEVIAADMVEKKVEGTEGKYRFVKIDATDPTTLKGLCDGADVVMTTMGLTGSSTRFTNYDIDYQGNLNLLNEAVSGKAKHFVYISVIKADSDPKVPMIHAKALFEEKLKASGLTYLIFRPTGYFYDIAKVFWPMVPIRRSSISTGRGSCAPTPTIRSIRSRRRTTRCRTSPRCLTTRWCSFRRRRSPRSIAAFRSTNTRRTASIRFSCSGITAWSKRRPSGRLKMVRGPSARRRSLTPPR